MAQYLKILNDIIIDSIIADEEFIEIFVDDTPGLWVLNEAGNGCIGYTYINGISTAPQPYNSWVLENNIWVSPVEYPEGDAMYTWNEETLAWDEVTDPTE